MLHTGFYTHTPLRNQMALSHPREGGGKEKINMAQSKIMPSNEFVCVMQGCLAFYYHCRSRFIAGS